MLAAEAVTLVYVDGGVARAVVNGVSLQVSPGVPTVIIGPSGSGKSSLLYLLSGLKRASGGDVCLDETRYSLLSDAALAGLRRRSFGFIFQQHFLVSYLSALENVLAGAPWPAAEYAARSRALLVQLGLAHRLQAQPAALSGGERQRVAIARSLANDPQVIFADEPTAALDRDNAAQVMELLRGYARERAVVVVTHDHSLLRPGDRVYAMVAGQVAPYDG